LIHLNTWGKGKGKFLPQKFHKTLLSPWQFAKIVLMHEKGLKK